MLAKEVQQSKNRIEQTYAVLQRLIQADEEEGDFLFSNPGAFTLELWYWAWLSVQVGSVPPWFMQFGWPAGWLAGLRWSDVGAKCQVQ